ncbi:MAG: helix-turn-helix transcriptional regulator [Solirubrobacterales bacterium]|nr:helix-turn-helix transcriptional regulator [Solirubrobacterales bacterium]
MSASQIQMDPALPPRESWADINDDCPIFQSLGVLSTRSAFLVLREAFYGATRFDQFAQRADISEPVAAARLKELTEAGLLEKHPYREPGQRTRNEYVLTDKGADLLPTLLALFRWGERWVFGDGIRADIAHASCGASVDAVVTCEHGHRVPPGELRFRRNPARAS